MSDVAVALTAATVTAVAAVGVGSLGATAAAGWDRGRRWLLRLVVGLGLLPLLQLGLFELTGLRVRAWMALALAAAGWVLALVQERRWRGAGDGDGGVDLAGLLVLCAGLLFAALAGLLGQPGFDGLDPWRHAFSTAWVVESGVLRQPDPGFPLVHYVDAYPPLFDILLALPAALLGHLPAAVKGVAALLVAVTPLALWLLARSLFADRRKAVLAAVLYALLPSAVNRHLWGHSLAIVLLLGGLGAVLELRRDRRWWAAAAVCSGGVLLAAPSQGLKAWGLLAVTAAVAAVVDRRWLLRLAAAASLGALVAAVWLLPAGLRYGLSPITLVRQMQPPELRRADHPLAGLDPGQEAPLPWVLKPQDRFGWREVLLFRPFPILIEHLGGQRVNLVVTAGLGLPLLLLVAAGATCCWRGPPAAERCLALLWLAAAALLTFAGPLGVTLFPWRSWLLLAPCAALVAAEGAARLAAGGILWPTAAAVVAALHGLAAMLFDLGSGLARGQWAQPWWLTLVAATAWLVVAASRRLDGHRRRWVVVVLLLCHLLVAGPVRAATLTDAMPPRVFYDRVEHRGYVELSRRLVPGSRVWPLSGGLRFDILVGLGLDCTPYRPAELEMARRCSDGVDLTADQVVAWARRNGYRWLVLDPSFGELERALDRAGETDRLRGELDADGSLRRVLSSETFAVWQILG